MAGDKFNFKILDPDRERCLKLSERCADALIINADARDTDALRDAGIVDTDAFIAISDSSESNILTCLSAKEFGVKKTIAEVENLQFISEAEGLNIGTVVNKSCLPRRVSIRCCSIATRPHPNVSRSLMQRWLKSSPKRAPKLPAPQSKTCISHTT